MKIILIKDEQNNVVGYQTFPLKPIEDVIDLTDKEFAKLQAHLEVYYETNKTDRPKQ